MPPVGDIERRIGHHKISTQVWMLVTHEAVGRLFAQIEVDTTNGKVHRRQSPGSRVGFLSVDRNVAQFAAMGFNKPFRLHKHAAGAATSVVDLAVMGVEDSNQQFNNGGGSETDRHVCLQHWQTDLKNIHKPVPTNRGHDF